MAKVKRGTFFETQCSCRAYKLQITSFWGFLYPLHQASYRGFAPEFHWGLLCLRSPEDRLPKSWFRPWSLLKYGGASFTMGWETWGLESEHFTDCNSRIRHFTNTNRHLIYTRGLFSIQNVWPWPGPCFVSLQFPLFGDVPLHYGLSLIHI